MTRPTSCPACNADWRGERIPAIARPSFGDLTHFTRAILVVDPGLDRTVAYRCPDCSAETPAGPNSLAGWQVAERRSALPSGALATAGRQLAAERRIGAPSRILRALIVGALAAAVLAGAWRCARAEDLPARQVWVIDGDTLDILVPVKERIRLRAIDAPESWQPHCPAEKAKGLEAKRAVIDLVRSSRTVTVSRGAGEADRYGRTLADMAADGEDIGRFLLGRGLALPYRPGPAAKAERIAHWCGPGAW